MLSHGQGGGPPVLRGDEVDGAPQERSLYDGAVGQGQGEVLTSEPLHPRPQSDVHRRRVLRLEPAHALEGAGDGGPRTLEQKLAREERAVELALREDALAHAKRTA